MMKKVYVLQILVFFSHKFVIYLCSFVNLLSLIFWLLTVICISYNIAAWTEATRETHMEESDGEGESETSSESHSSTFSNQSDKSNHATCLTDDGKFDL